MKQTLKLNKVLYSNSFLATEHHPIYGTFGLELPSCIFEWDQYDFCSASAPVNWLSIAEGELVG